MGTRFTAGPITASQAAQLNEMMRFYERFPRMSVAAPLNLNRGGGIPSLSIQQDPSAWKEPVRVASTANATLSTAYAAGQVVDGVTLVGGDRILLKNQTSQPDNGIYIVNPSGSPTRAPDSNTGDKLYGATVFVSEGTAGKDTVWMQTTDKTITVGTSNIVWAQLGASAAATVSAWKEPARAATTANGTLSTAFAAGSVIDGVTLATGDRILIKNQSSSADNGIYTVNGSGAPTRATDADTGSELVGAVINVEEGTKNADTVWNCTTNATITIGVTGIAWRKVGPYLYSAAKVKKSATQSFTSGAGANVQWDGGTVFDTDTYWSSGANTKLTVPEAGLYAVGATVSWDSDAGPDALDIAIVHNGTTYIAVQDLRDSAAFLLARNLNCSGIHTCSAGDYFQVLASQNSAGALNVTATTSNFWIYRVFV